MEKSFLYLKSNKQKNMLFILFFFISLSAFAQTENATTQSAKEVIAQHDKYNLQFVDVDKDPRIVQIKKEILILDKLLTEKLKDKQLTAQEEAIDPDIKNI